MHHKSREDNDKQIEISLDPAHGATFNVDSCRACCSKEPILSVSLCGRISAQSCVRRGRHAVGHPRKRTFHITDLATGRTCNVKAAMCGRVVNLQALSPHLLLAVCTQLDVGSIRLLEIDYKTGCAAVSKEAVMVSCDNRHINYSEGYAVLYNQLGVGFEVYEAATLHRLTHYTPDRFQNLESQCIAVTDQRRYWAYSPQTREMLTTRIVRHPDHILVNTARDLLSYPVDGGKPTTIMEEEMFGARMPDPGQYRNPIDFVTFWRGHLISLQPATDRNWPEGVAITKIDDRYVLGKTIALNMVPPSGDWYWRGIQPADNGCIHILFGRTTIQCVRLDLNMMPNWSRRKNRIVRELGLQPLFPQMPIRQSPPKQMTEIEVDPASTPAITLNAPEDSTFSMSPCGRLFACFSHSQQKLMVQDRLNGQNLEIRPYTVRQYFDGYFTSLDRLVFFSVWAKRCRIGLFNADRDGYVHLICTVTAAGVHRLQPEIIVANRNKYFFILPVDTQQPITVFSRMQKLRTFKMDTVRKFGAFRVDDCGDSAIAVSRLDGEHSLEVGNLRLNSGEYSPKFRIRHSNLGSDCLKSAVWCGDRLLACHKGPAAEGTNEIHWIDVATGKSGEFRLRPTESTPRWRRGPLIGGDDAAIFAVFGEWRHRCVRIPIRRPETLGTIAQRRFAATGGEWPEKVELPAPLFDVYQKVESPKEENVAKVEICDEWFDGVETADW